MKDWRRNSRFQPSLPYHFAFQTPGPVPGIVIFHRGMTGFGLSVGPRTRPAFEKKAWTARGFSSIIVKKSTGMAIVKSSQADIQRSLDVIAGILIRCFLGGMALLLVWVAWFVLAGDWIYQIHSRWFQIPRQSFDAIHYAGMAVTKIAIILFFLLPWIAIKLMPGKKNS
jgi:hypothetical protein